MTKTAGFIEIKKVSHIRKDDKLINLINRQIVTVVKTDPVTMQTTVTYFDYDLGEDIVTTISVGELEDYRLILNAEV